MTNLDFLRPVAIIISVLKTRLLEMRVFLEIGSRASWSIKGKPNVYILVTTVSSVGEKEECKNTKLLRVYL